MNTNIITIPIDSVQVRLCEYHDLSFLGQLGEVFYAFDEQDSGNICFGVESGSEKLFVKYAGARTIKFTGNSADAVDRLKEAMPVYQALQHPHLIELREHFSVGEGYAAVYTWFPGECLYANWPYAPVEKYQHFDLPAIRHRQLPLARRLDTLEAIFAFHEHVARQGNVAVDFYDGSILYDFTQQQTKICDIDVYHSLPYSNTMGRMWGSKRFMSPEEFEYGAAIDEVTNVYTMGATAFVLLGGTLDRSIEKWDGSAALFEVAQKAVNPDRGQRYPTIATFRHAWNAARALLGE
ncbi:MAG: serine/threonine protein kinase [bacterium]